jgi:hypothetical protein
MRRLLTDRAASSAAEFALVLPLMILLLFGVIDAGRFLWEINRAEKATAAGARVAVVTDALPGGLQSASYVGVGGLTQGDLIPASAFGQVRCTSTACTCVTTPCPTLGTFDANDVFGRVILPRMKAMKRDIAPANVLIEYSGSGLGYAGDPNGMEIAPLVTVSLTGLRFDPLILFGFADFDLPDFRTTLTAEDSAGEQSN